jgi:anti-sigma B factor antagonist
MEVNKTTADGIVTLNVSGKLSAATAEDFNVKVEASLDEAEKGLIMDFKDVSYLASAGLRVLVATQKKLAPKGFGIKFINLSDDVREVFEITGLDDVFELED